MLERVKNIGLWIRAVSGWWWGLTLVAALLGYGSLRALLAAIWSGMPLDAQLTLAAGGAAAGFLAAAKTAHYVQNRPTKFGASLREELHEHLSPQITDFVEAIGLMFEAHSDGRSWTAAVDAVAFPLDRSRLDDELLEFARLVYPPGGDNTPAALFRRSEFQTTPGLGLESFTAFHQARRGILRFFEDWEERTRGHPADRRLAERKLGVRSTGRVLIMSLYLDHVLALNNGNESPLAETPNMTWLNSLYGEFKQIEMSDEPDTPPLALESRTDDLAGATPIPEDQLEWADLAPEAKAVLESTVRKGAVFELRLTARTKMLEEHTFIERVYDLDGLRAGFRLTPKSKPHVEAYARRQWRGY